MQVYSIYPLYTIIFFYKGGYRDDLHDLHTYFAICLSDPFLPAPDARPLSAAAGKSRRLMIHCHRPPGRLFLCPDLEKREKRPVSKIGQILF
jgi:hypothetical protein